MLQEAIDLQNDAVTKLVQLAVTEKPTTFKAPTGSGKTYMMADMMSRILKENPSAVFLISTLSKGDLATQNYTKFVEYRKSGQFKNLNPYLISTRVAEEETLFIPTDFNVYLLPRDLYKKNGKLMRGPMENFLHKLVLSEFLGGPGKQIYLIKDECHIATNNLDDLSAEFFTKTFNFSATPNSSRGQHPDVEITIQDAVNAKLIKDVNFVDDDQVSISEAIQTFENIKADYRNLVGVNPCLIIQISNKHKAEAEVNQILAELNKPEHNLKWMLIVDNDKDCRTNDVIGVKGVPASRWKEYAKGASSLIDIIIFKMVIAEGWDIPRACMLYQMRDTKSKQLDEQVMGRVRRNPRLLDFEFLNPEAQHLATTSWIWGVTPKDSPVSRGVKLREDSSLITQELLVKTTIIKEKQPEFELAKFLKECSPITAPTSIFDLYDGYRNAPYGVKARINDYSTSYANWREAAENVGTIKSQYETFSCDYSVSMDVNKDENGNIIEVSLPQHSHFPDHGNPMSISDWVWQRTDGKERFSFDSEAEKEWAEVLGHLAKEDNDDDHRVTKRIKVGKRNPNAGEENLFGDVEPELISPKSIYLWGKNFLANSDIRFRYYLDGLHWSYPDFVMKDAYDRVHIFEVKSVNISQAHSAIGNSDYEPKIEELKKAYKEASRLMKELTPKQIFYLPILRDDEWRIFQYLDGEENLLSKSQFEDFCKAQP